MAVTIRDLVVAPTDINVLLVSWEAFGVTSGIFYTIERSNSPEGPWETLSTGTLVDTTTQYVDNTIRPEAKHRIYYYQVTLGTQVLGPARVMVDPDRIAYGIVYQNKRSLQRSLGTDCKLFVRMTAGTNCINCYDPFLERADDGECATCFGTNYEGGYFDPISVLVAFPKEAVMVVHEGEMEKVPMQVNGAWASNYPVFHPGDIIVREYDLTVWRIDNPVVRTAKKNYIISQKFTLTQLERDNIEYGLLARL